MLSIKELKKTAQEFIDVQGLSEPDKNGEAQLIVLKKDATPEFLIKFIKDGIKEIIPDDKFSEETKLVMNELSETDVMAEVNKQEDDDVQAEIENVDDGLPDDETLLWNIKDAKKMKELKDIAKVEPLFKPIRNNLSSYKTEDELREVMIDLLVNKDVIEKLKPKVVEGYDLSIDDMFSKACPKLSDEEFEKLETLILKDGVINNPIMVWNNKIVDGFHRYAIAKKHDIGYNIKDKEFASDKEAVQWIKEHALGQRNLTDFAKFELIKDLEHIYKEQGEKNKKIAIENRGKKEEDKVPIVKVNARKELAKKSGISPTQVAKAKKVEELVDEDTKAKLRSGEEKLGKVYDEITKKPPVKKNILTEGETLKESAVVLNEWADKYSKLPYFKEYIILMEDLIDMILDKADEEIEK